MIGKRSGQSCAAKMGSERFTFLAFIYGGAPLGTGHARMLDRAAQPTLAILPRVQLSRLTM